MTRLTRLVAVAIVPTLLFIVPADQGSAADDPAPTTYAAGESAQAQSEVPLTSSPTVKVAAVHFRPILGDVVGNRAALVDLATEAAQNGAKIIVLPEMATSGYSFFSRADIATVAETVPGPSSDALAAVADQFDAYIVFGMPEYRPNLDLYFNAAVLLNPEGDVELVYRKRNHLIESAYNAIVAQPIPTVDTPYGRLAITICSDMFYAQFPRAAAVQGTNILLAPANTGVEPEFFSLRTVENDFSMIVANRYGEEIAGAEPTSFTEDTFTIASPFAYNFNLGTRSMVVDDSGAVLAHLTAQEDAIGYADLPVQASRQFPVVRRPHMYTLLAQDTLESFTQQQFQLPAETTFATAAVDPGPSADPWSDALTAVQDADSEASTQGKDLRLAVLPADYFPTHDAAAFSSLQSFSQAEGVDILLGYAKTASDPPRSVLIASDGNTYEYKRSHKLRGENLSPALLGDDYLVVDRDYARVALMQDTDMVAPETVHVMSRMGVDVIAVNARIGHGGLSYMWQSRTADGSLHIVVSNSSQAEGVYHGGYQVFPGFTEQEGLVLADLDTGHVRPKRQARFFDYRSILQPCGQGNC